jgi:hypothetical protein
MTKVDRAARREVLRFNTFQPDNTKSAIYKLKRSFNGYAKRGDPRLITECTVLYSTLVAYLN